MKNLWLFASNSLENIEEAYKNLLWGFWDKDLLDTGRKKTTSISEIEETNFMVNLTRHWRNFLRCFNEIKPFDIAVLQIAKSYEIHALGVVKRTYYDDETPIWSREFESGKILFPWRVKFSIILYSKEPFLKHATPLETYIGGYGLSELPDHDFRQIVRAITNQTKIHINL